MEKSDNIRAKAIAIMEVEGKYAFYSAENILEDTFGQGNRFNNLLRLRSSSNLKVRK